MIKKEIRKIYREKRAAITPSVKNKLEDLMLIGFQKLDLHIPNIIMTYAAFEDEVDPKLITDYCQFRNPARQLLYPVINKEADNLLAMATNDDTIFNRNALGIDEPSGGHVMEPEDIDLLIVPLLSFDSRGYRVGYGKGYYDKFLKNCRKDAIKIGFSFFEPEDVIDDVNHFDIRLNHCITPENIYHFTA